MSVSDELHWIRLSVPPVSTISPDTKWGSGSIGKNTTWIPLPGPEVGLLSNTQKRIVRGDTCWQSKRFYWERAPGWRAVGKGTQENCSATCLAVLGFMVMGLVSGWSVANHSNSVFPGGAHMAQPRWMLARGILGSGRTGSVSSRPFPNSSSWWWLISSIFFVRISCHKTTHANGRYGAWPERVVSISVLPLTQRLCADSFSQHICFA